VRDLSAECRHARTNEFPRDLAACQFFLLYGAPGVVCAFTQVSQETSSSSQDSGEESKEDGEMLIEGAVDELEGSDDDCHPSTLEWDDRPAKDLPQEPPVDPMYCRLCLKTPCVFLQWQDEL
jgi:hypothetical protein